MYQVLGAWGQRGEEDASDLCFPDASTEPGEDTCKRTHECSEDHQWTCLANIRSLSTDVRRLVFTGVRPELQCGLPGGGVHLAQPASQLVFSTEGVSFLERSVRTWQPHPPACGHSGLSVVSASYCLSLLTSDSLGWRSSHHLAPEKLNWSLRTSWCTGHFPTSSAEVISQVKSRGGKVRPSQLT